MASYPSAQSEPRPTIHFPSTSILIPVNSDEERIAIAKGVGGVGVESRSHMSSMQAKTLLPGDVRGHRDPNVRCEVAWDDFMRVGRSSIL